MSAITILRPNIVSESAKKLGDLLVKAGFKVSIVNPFESYVNILPGVTYFNYGSSTTYYDNIHKFLNKGSAVRKCIDKVSTFAILKAVGAPTVDFCTKVEDVPTHWQRIVSRASKSAARGEGLDVHERGEKLPKGELFTEYFDHDEEFRFYVFKGKVVGRYLKEYVDEDNHGFFEVYAKGLEEVSKACTKAAKALGIDFVGFDILRRDDGEFVILEANSAPLLTDEVAVKIVKYFKSTV